MPVPKKRTTSICEATQVESADHTMPDEQEFRQRMLAPCRKSYAGLD